MELEELMARHRREVEDASVDAARDVELEVEPDLRANLLGGTQYATVISITRRSTGERFDLEKRYFEVGVPDPENGQYDYREIATEKHEASMHSGLSVREMKARKLPCTARWLGNVVIALDKDGDWLLVVSVSGLSDNADEMIAGLTVFRLKLKILRLLAMEGNA